jgi:hypothetical protein
MLSRGRGSAAECASIVNVHRLQPKGSTMQHRQVGTPAARLVEMLIRLCASKPYTHSKQKIDGHHRLDHYALPDYHKPTLPDEVPD